MGTLFTVKHLEPKKKTSKIKLKKGETISSLVEVAKKLVEEKLKNYKDTSRCITDIEDLKKFYDETPDGAEIGVDTETMRSKLLFR